MAEIRTLRPDEIECRVQSVTDNGCILLIYKDARVDMRILDEVYGIDGWQRTHEVINGNLFCTIEIWSEKLNCWVKKQDVGTESNTEKEKGEASDSFKRAGFNVGIGRELYSAPFTWVNLNQNEISEYNGKKQLAKGIKFTVKSISYNDNKEIISMVIVDNKGNVRFEMGKPIEIPKEEKANQQPVKTPAQMEFETAKNEMNNCPTKEHLSICWTKWKKFQANPEFIQLKETLKSKLQ